MASRKPTPIAPITFDQMDFITTDEAMALLHIKTEATFNKEWKMKLHWYSSGTKNILFEKKEILSLMRKKRCIYTPQGYPNL